MEVELQYVERLAGAPAILVEGVDHTACPEPTR
jgi:flagellar biosynthesis protein FlhB